MTLKETRKQLVSKLNEIHSYINQRIKDGRKYTEISKEYNKVLNKIQQVQDELHNNQISTAEAGLERVITDTIAKLKVDELFGTQIYKIEYTIETEGPRVKIFAST